MCKICGRTPCLATCPRRKKALKDFLRRPERDLCVWCGESVLEDRGYYERNGFPYCESCISMMDNNSILRNCENPLEEWIERMGFSYVGNHEKEGVWSKRQRQNERE